ncbi:MAG: asparagine synthase (glutamine-hydrolyzing) [Verrucomicrobiales bacterium]
MCGIVGYLGFDEPGLIERMAAVIQHRGPDGDGFYADEPNAFHMGMRRLSIIDLDGGWQPIFNEDGTVAVCYNGEIYNYVELMDELKAKGHVFKTRSDTEVIVHAYEEWGIDCLERFNGMFGFALYDSRTQELFLARDRCGQKPIYWWRGGGKFIFASEVKAILESQHAPREPNAKAVDAYLGLRVVPEPETMFKDIYTLRAGHYLRIKRGADPDIRRYWDIALREDRNYKSDGEYLEELGALFRDAVKLTMRSDVPVGAYLSAGVDSSLIVAAMREFNADVKTYSIGFNSPIDETRDAAETARLLGTDHHEIHCSPEDFDLLPKIIYHMDRPVGDALIIAFYKLAQRASQDLKVVLGGEGADEMFAGYQFHKVIPLVEKYHRMMPGFLHHGVMMPAFHAAPLGLLNKFFDFPADLGRRQGAVRRLPQKLRNAAPSSKTMPRSKRCTKTSAAPSIATRSRRRRATRGSRRCATAAGGSSTACSSQYDEWLQDWAIIRQDKNTMTTRWRSACHSSTTGSSISPSRCRRTSRRMAAKTRSSSVSCRKMLPPEVFNRKKNPFFLPMAFFYEHPQIRELIKLTLNPDQVKKRPILRPRPRHPSRRAHGGARIRQPEAGHVARHPRALAHGVYRQADAVGLRPRPRVAHRRRPKQRVPLLVLHHRYANPASSENPEKDYIGKAPHERLECRH